MHSIKHTLAAQRSLLAKTATAGHPGNNDMSRLHTLLERIDKTHDIVFLTGAGISAESGIPTFRGAGGYWTIGSEVYQPQELATWTFFQQMPWEVWRWYLYRRGACAAASPNTAHDALVTLQNTHPNRFHLITQNVDGLHSVAGGDPTRIYEVHGNGHQMRCAARCCDARFPIPDRVAHKGKNDSLTDAERTLLSCPRCGGLARPHVLWFDECYEEELYRSDTAMRAAANASVFVTVGTSGATSLPIRAAVAAAQAGALLIDINPENNPFQAFANDCGGVWMQDTASAAVPALVEVLLDAYSHSS